jgi:hypothetical protein
MGPLPACSSEALDAPIDAGRTVYDGAAAALCLASLASASCAAAALTLDSPDCQMIFAGQIAEGGTCASNNECVPSAWCNVTPGTCGGTCVARVAIGQPTSVDGACAIGAAAYAGYCIQPLSFGQRCDSDDGGFALIPCTAPSVCGSFRQPDGGLHHACALLGDAGAPCTDEASSIFACSGYGFCDPQTQRCRPLSGLNDPCGPNAPSCRSDLWCNGGLASPQCQARSPTGGPCTSDFSCSAGVCDGGKPFNPDGGPWPLGACVPLPGMGDPCTYMCASGLMCDSTGHCGPFKADGAPCTSSFECASASCNSFDGGGQICGPCP